jgi:large subunit ribosomal protein L9
MLEARNVERKSKAQTVADALTGRGFVVVRPAGETGQLYGSVATRDVVEILDIEGFSVGRNQVGLSAPIKTIGIHKVTLYLHSDVEFSIELNIARSPEEAERQAKGENMASDDTFYGADEAAGAFDRKDDFDGDSR